MSWDIFVQEIPDEFQTVEEIPDDWIPSPLGKRSSIIAQILEVVPDADFTDPAWGIIDSDGCSIEINLGEDESIEGFAFHVRGGSAATRIIADILDHIELRAFDTNSPTGIFSRNDSEKSLAEWQKYRDHVLSSSTE